MENYHFKKYESPFGSMYMESDGSALTGLWFEQQKTMNCKKTESEAAVFDETKQWLDDYFQGKCPKFLPNIKLQGTEFQMQVWELLLKIPYGKTITYGFIAEEIAKIRNLEKMSAQAVGQAVGHNPVSVIVPCHRVIGKDHSLTGYAGGLIIKKNLLQLEGIRIITSGGKEYVK